MLNQSILEKIHQVPPLPDSVIKAEKLFSQSDPDMIELIKIVEEDPVLTANLLALANSSLYAFSKNVLSVRQAVTLFGMTSVRGFILSSIAMQNFKFDMSPYGITNKNFQDISQIQSTLMFQWFMTINIKQSGILVPIAFLMDIGKIIIAKEIVELNKVDSFSEKIKISDSISEVEKEYTGMTSAEITSLLFEYWNFNEVFSNVIKDSDEPYYADEEYQVMCQAIDVVKTCVNVKGIMTEKNFKSARMKSLQYGLSVANFIKVTDRIQKKLSSQS